MEATGLPGEAGEGVVRKPLVILCFMLGSLLAGCNQSSAIPVITLTPAVPGCFDYIEPLDVLSQLKLPSLYVSFMVSTSETSTIEIRDYTQGKIAINADMLKIAYELAGAIDINRDLVREGENKQTYVRTAIPKGTLVLIHNGEPSIKLRCRKQFNAVTYTSRDDAAPRVSEISLRKIEEQGGDIAQAINVALATEICQQYAKASDHHEYHETLCNGFGFLVAYINAHIMLDKRQDMQYQDYTTKARNITVTADVSSRPLPIAIFTERFYKMAIDKLMALIIQLR